MTQALAPTAGIAVSSAALARRAWPIWQQQAVSPSRRVAPRQLLTEPIQAMFSLPNADVHFFIYPPEPDWLYPMLDTLLQFSRLPDNWDTYGGAASTTVAVSTALDVISRLLRDDSVPPVPVPTSEGGVQFEWYRGPGDELEIRIGPNGEISVFRFNEKAGELTEPANVTIDKLQPLVAPLIGRL